MTSKLTCNVNGNMMHLNLLHCYYYIYSQMLDVTQRLSPLNSYQKVTHEMATVSLHIQSYGVKSEPQHSWTLLCPQSFQCFCI